VTSAAPLWGAMAGALRTANQRLEARLVLPDFLMVLMAPLSFGATFFPLPFSAAFFLAATLFFGLFFLWGFLTSFSPQFSFFSDIDFVKPYSITSLCYSVRVQFY